MKPVKTRKVERALVRLGYQMVRIQGSHRIYRHPVTLVRTTVPFHGAGEDLPTGTLHAILADIGMTWANFEAHL